MIDYAINVMHASDHVLSETGDDVAAWMSAVLASVDRMDTPRFLSFLTDDAVFHFANAPAAIGKAAVGDMVNRFFARIMACRHDIENAWAPPGHAIGQGNVTYTRVDGSTLALAFANVFSMRHGKIADYRIYIDASALYGPSQ